MSVATFSQQLRIFRREENYGVPCCYHNASKDNTQGRITWSGCGKWLCVAPLDSVGGPLPIFKYTVHEILPIRYVNLTNVTSASFFNWKNRNLAVGKQNGEVLVWDVKEKKVGSKLEITEKHPVDFVSVNADDNYIASGSLSSNKISLHGLKSNKLIKTFTVPKSNHTSSLKCSISRKSYIGISSIESTICVYDIMKSGFVFKQFNSHSGACTDISFSPVTHELLASVSLTKTLRLYDVRQQEMVLDVYFDEPLNCVDFFSNGEKVVMGTSGGSVIIYDLKAGQTSFEFKAHATPIFSVKAEHLRISKSYEEVEINTPETVENLSRTLDLSVMDVFSPIYISNKKNLSGERSNGDKGPLQSTPNLSNTTEPVMAYEDSFLKKVLSPTAVEKGLQVQNAVTSSNSLDTINESPPDYFNKNIIMSDGISGGSENCLSTVKIGELSKDAFRLGYGKESVNHFRNFNEQVLSDSYSTPKEGFSKKQVGLSPIEPVEYAGIGDGHHIDSTHKQIDFSKEIINEIRNSNRMILDELDFIKKEVNDIKVEFENKFKAIEQRFDQLKDYLRDDIKMEIQNGNYDAKIEHISQRIILNEVNESLITNDEVIHEQVRANTLRLIHIYQHLTGTDTKSE